MDTLLNELFDVICNNLTCITDVRNLSRVCKSYNLSCQKQINKLVLSVSKKKKHK